VDRLARRNPETFAGLQARMFQETLSPFGACIGDIGSVGY
jgi:hypothetical protein